MKTFQIYFFENQSTRESKEVIVDSKKSQFLGKIKLHLKCQIHFF